MAISTRFIAFRKSYAFILSVLIYVLPSLIMAISWLDTVDQDITVVDGCQPFQQRASLPQNS